MITNNGKEMNQMRLVHGSLFSGFDAPSVAASWMGWENAFHCEINHFCNEILKYWFPNSEHYEDITKTDFSQWKGRIDVLTGGFPCQPFSIAGKRKGADDNRYLWPHMLRAIREIRPTWVIGENVAGILTMVQPGEEVEVGNQTSLFGEGSRKRVLLRQEYVVKTICKDLEREGYSVQPMLIPACAVGAPHRRDRVWIIANRTDTGTESMQQTGEDGVHAVGSTSNTNCQRSEEVHKEIQSQKPNGERADGSRCELFTTHAYGDGWSGRCCEGGGNENKETFGGNVLAKTKGFNWEQSASDSDSKRFPTFGFTSSVNKEEWTNENRCPMQSSCNAGKTSRTDWWKELPTQSPVCRRNDGLPFNVDDLTIPFTKWRQESIKGYGNAIVPQVILEIFKAIEEVEKLA